MTIDCVRGRGVKLYSLACNNSQSGNKLDRPHSVAWLTKTEGTPGKWEGKGQTPLDFRTWVRQWWPVHLCVIKNRYHLTTYKLLTALLVNTETISDELSARQINRLMITQRGQSTFARVTLRIVFMVLTCFMVLKIIINKSLHNNRQLT